MFPNVRLMIAATLASVVALISGFGMFAVFRVSHEPFVRLPAATASLRLVADDAVRSAAALASGEPLDRDFQAGTQPGAAAMAYADEAAPQHPAAAEVAPATALLPAATAPEATFATAGEPPKQPAAAVAPAGDTPAAAAIDPQAGDPLNTASTSEAEVAPATASADANTAAKIAANTAAETAATPPDTTVAETDQDSKPPVAAAPSTEPAPGGIPEAAASEAPKEPPPAAEPAVVAAAPADAGNPADERAQQTEVKKPKRSRVAARLRRARRLADTQYSENPISPTQYSPASGQNFGGTQISFRTEPSQTQYFVRRAVRIHHSRIATQKPKELNKEPNKELSKEPDKEPNKEPNTATGGPFVSVTNH